MNDKCKTFGLALCLLTASQANAQLTIQGNSLLIQKDASIHFDGLTLTPAFAINLINKEMTRFEIPIVGSPYPSVNRIYKIDSKMLFTGKIGFHYEPSELNGNDESLLQLAFGNEALEFTKPTNKSTINLNKHYIEEDVINQELWAITATTSGSILPVILIDFSAVTNEASVSLAWKTSEETNSDFFEIQHSINGKQWTEVGRVAANGHSKEPRTYAFQHDSPADGENLYRLKMVDRDGSYAYSRVRNVHWEGAGELTLHPNPVSDWLRIDAADWDSFKNLQITNASGVKMGEFGESQLQEMAGRDINVQDFPAGMYIISITKKDGTMQSEKIFKN